MADDKDKLPKPASEPEPFPVAEEGPLPKDVPDEPAARAAMMAQENADSLATAVVPSKEREERADRAALMARENQEGMATAITGDDEREDRARRAALMAQENLGIQVPEKEFRATMK
jgi:hypothetical protein